MPPDNNIFNQQMADYNKKEIAFLGGIYISDEISFLFLMKVKRKTGKRLHCFFLLAASRGGILERMVKCCDNFCLVGNPLCFQREIAGLESLCTQYMQQ